MMKKTLKSSLTKLFIVLIFSLSICLSVSAAAVTRDWLWPVPGINRLSSCFGDGRTHNAIDIAAPQGTPVIASMSGTVVKTYSGCPNNFPKSGNCPCGLCLNLGNYVYIEHTYNGKNYISRYGHFTDISVSVGDKVKAGDVIGTVGCTGRSTGFHLDFQIYEGTLSKFVKYIDPLKSPFLIPPEGLNANAASTACCYTYVKEVYAVLNEETDYKSKCKVEKLTNYDGYALRASSVMSLPCGSDVFSFIYETTSLAKNEEFSVIERVTNTKGEVWYYIVTEYSVQGYVKAENVYIMELSRMYARVKTTAAVKAYSAPNASSGTSRTYTANSTIIIHGTVSGSDGDTWYVTNENTFIPFSSLGSITPQSALKINGAPYPYDSLPKGSAYSIKGYASTDNKITRLAVKITNSAGKTVINKSVSADSVKYSFRGSSLDYAIPFSTLASGEYTYTLTITESALDAGGKTHTFSTTLSSKFAVGNSYKTSSITVTDSSGEVTSVTVSDNYSVLAKYDKITISGSNQPSSIELGSAFSIHGSVSSGESNLTDVSVIISDKDGKSVIKASAAPGKTSYSISSLDNQVKFGSLPAGEYLYTIKATNSSGTATLVSSKFTVIDNSAPQPPVTNPGSLDNFKVVREYNNKFGDVPIEQWYYTNVNLAYTLGIVNGVSDDKFFPDARLTIAECITIASKMHSIYYNLNTVFPPTPVWYDAYVSYAAEHGIITQQYSNYNAYATRKEVAVIFANAFPKEALAERNNISSGAIPDVPLSAPYAEAVYTLYKAGIIRGSDEMGSFAPDSSILRSEISAIITRLALVDIRISFSL